MDIRKFLTTEEKVAGIAISDSKISIAFLKSLPRIKGKGIVIENLKEINLPEGIIEQGVVKNKTALISAFKKLILDLYILKKIPKVLPAILSLSSQRIYSQLFDFPDRITYDRLEESMKLTVGFSLPLKAEDCYLDWETISFEEKKVLLALIKKEIIDPYLEVFNKVPILPIACELHPLSLNRIISSFEENPFCLAFIDSQGIEVSISKGKTLRFMEGLYWKDHLSPAEMQKVEERNKIATELILKTINFYQTDKIDSGFIEKIYLIGEFSEISPFSKSLKERSGKEVIIPEVPFEIEVAKKVKHAKSKITKLTNLENEKKKELENFEERNKKEITDAKNKLAEFKERKEKNIKELADLEKQKGEVLMIDTKTKVEKEKSKKELPNLENQNRNRIRDLESEEKKEMSRASAEVEKLEKQKEIASSLIASLEEKENKAKNLKAKIEKAKVELEELKKTEIRRFPDLERKKEIELKDLENRAQKEIEKTKAEFERLDRYRESVSKKINILEEQRKEAEDSKDEVKAAKIKLQIGIELKKQEDSISSMKASLAKQKLGTESLMEESEKAKNELLELKKEEPKIKKLSKLEEEKEREIKGLEVLAEKEFEEVKVKAEELKKLKEVISLAEIALQYSEGKAKNLREEREKITQELEELKKQKTAQIQELSKSEDKTVKETKETKIAIQKIEKLRKEKELEIKSLSKLEKEKEKELKNLKDLLKKTIEKLKAELEKLQKSKKNETDKIPAFEIPQIDQITNRFLVTFGAALRGLILRAKDTFISLLPVGTEERYTKSRVISLLNFVRNWAAVTALILIILFAGVYFLVNKFNLDIEKELANLKARPATEELQKIENIASEFNKNVALMESLEKEISEWSKLFEGLDKNRVSGITFTGLEAKSFQKEIILKGVAEKREDLLDFKENLTKSEFFTGVEIPTKILEEAEEVQFIIQFQIK